MCILQEISSVYVCIARTKQNGILRNKLMVDLRYVEKYVICLYKGLGDYIICNIWLV